MRNGTVGITRGEFLKLSLCSGAFAATRPLRVLAEDLPAGNPNLILGIISDVHVAMRRKNGQLVFEGEERLRRTFEWFRSRRVDAVAICGDMADQGLREELNAVGRSWLSVFPDDKAPDGRHVEKLFVYGNHDWEGYKYGDAARKFFGAEGYDHAINKDLAAAWREAFREEYAPIWRKEIKGYSFVGAHWIADHCRGWDEIGVPQAAPWFKSNMRTLDPKKPFFYLQHPPLKDTCHGPWHWGHDIGEMTRLFAESFPNAIALTGHSHASLSDDRAIWKKEFVSINAGSLKYTGLEYGDLAPNIRENDGGMRGLSAEMLARRVMRRISTGDGHHGLLARVYDDRIIFERRDFEDLGLLGEDWILPLGKGVAIRHGNVAPQFANGAALAVHMGSGKNRGGGAVRSEDQVALEIKIPPANRHCAGRVFDYRITIAGTNGATDEKFVFSEGFHRSATSSRANAPTIFKVALGALSARGDLDIRVAPRSSLGAEGDALAAKFSLSDEPDAFVEYVESNGTQYIDTGVIGRCGTSAEMTIRWLGAIDSSFLSSRVDDGNTRFILCSNQGGGERHYYMAHCGYERGRDTTVSTCNPDETVRIASAITRDGSNVKYAMRLNDAKEINVVRPEAAIDTGLSMYLFAQNQRGSAVLKSSVRCYGVKIWQDGVLVRDFKPCVKNAGTCLYDAVTKKLFYPLGGSLLAGPVGNGFSAAHE